MPSIPIVINWIPPKKLTNANNDVQPLIEDSGLNTLFITKPSAKIKEMKVTITPKIEEKCSGLSLNDVRPSNAKFMYFFNENVDEPAYLTSLRYMIAF